MNPLRRIEARDDEGMTVMELLFTSIILLVLLGMVFGSMSLINDISSDVTAQYQEFDQALPAMAPFQRLIANEVEPAPPAINGTPTSLTNGGIPTPGFASVGNFSLTFYANIGTEYGNAAALTCPITTPTTAPCQTSSTAGPALILAQEVDSSGQPVTGASTCGTSTPCSLQVKLFLPVTNQGVPTCPLYYNGADISGTCQYPCPTDPVTGAYLCQNAQSGYRLLANIQGVVNNPNTSDPNNIDVNGAPLHPIFTYSIQDPSQSPAQSFTLSPSDVQTGNISLQTLAAYDATASIPLASCANSADLALSCPLDAIQSVGIDLRIAEPGSHASSQLENRLVVYRQSTSANLTAPYQYSDSVG